MSYLFMNLTDCLSSWLFLDQDTVGVAQAMMRQYSFTDWPS